jgi:Na+-transporting NADH:ubiquinone oxidoreductase subunit NqrF
MEVWMKQLTLVVATVLVLCAGRALATPPDSIGLKYDDSTHVFSVAVYHPVKSSLAEHHIGKVIVDLNGTVMATQTFNTQTNASEQFVSYVLIDAKPGDKIGVTGVCSLFGQLKATKTVAPR